MAERRSGLPFEEELLCLQWSRFLSPESKKAEYDEELIEVVAARLKEVESSRWKEILAFTQGTLTSGGFPSNRIEPDTINEKIFQPLCELFPELRETSL